jgi:hypothetical protein
LSSNILRVATVLFAAGCVLGCESGGGGPTITAMPAGSSSGTPAAVPVGPPRGPSPRERAIKRVTLLEATGKGPEADAFVSRFQSDVSDKDLFVLSDARLAGASLPSLAADPQGPAATRFRAEWPAQAWLSISVGECHIKGNRVATPDSSNGYRTMNVTITYDASCPATMKLADAEDGHVLATIEVTGSASYTGDTESGETPAEEAAARDAAARAVKKLRSHLAR